MIQVSDELSARRRTPIQLFNYYLKSCSIGSQRFACRDDFSPFAKAPSVTVVATDFGEVRDRGEFAEQLGQERESISADRFVLDHDHDFFEKAVDRLA